MKLRRWINPKWREQRRMMKDPFIKMAVLEGKMMREQLIPKVIRDYQDHVFKAEILPKLKKMQPKKYIWRVNRPKPTESEQFESKVKAILRKP